MNDKRDVALTNDDDLSGVTLMQARLITALDSDPAGQQASTVAEEHLGPAARRLDIPDVKDVAELATVPGGRELFEAALEPWHALAA